MEEARRKALRVHREHLRTEVIVAKLLDDCRQLLTDVEYSRVNDKSKADNESAVDELINVLLKKEDKDLDGFCSALRANGWATKLEVKAQKVEVDSISPDEPPLLNRAWVEEEPPEANGTSTWAGDEMRDREVYTLSGLGEATYTSELGLLSQSVHSLDHKQCVMLFRRFVSRTAAGCGRAVLEGVGLSYEAIQMCYSKSFQNEEEAIQLGLMKWRDGKEGSPTWEVLIEAMEYAEIGVQHIKEMKEELLKALSRCNRTAPHSTEVGGNVASDSKLIMTSSSSDLHEIMHTYTTGIIACDMDIIRSKKDPEKAIKSLYFNAYSMLIRILRTCYSSIKMSALDAALMQQVDATEEEVNQAQDLSALFRCLKINKNWNDFHFLDVAITSLPPEECQKREAARLVLDQYRSYLMAYQKAVSIKEGKSDFGVFQRKRGREERWVVAEVTVDKDINEYTYGECLELWKLFLIKSLEIPEDHIQFCGAIPGNSTTLVFMVLQTFAERTKKKLSKPAAVWLMKELGILRVHVTGVFSMDVQEVLPNVLTASIREGLEAGVDFMSITKDWSPLMCSLVDQVPKPKWAQLGRVQPYPAPPAKLPIPERVVEAAASASLLKDFLYAAWEGRLHNVQSLLDGGRCKPTDEDEEGWTAILTAAHKGRLTVLQTLVEQYGGNVLHRKKGGHNAFLLCAAYGHLPVAEYLVPKMEGHLFHSDDAGYTALHWAAQEGQLPMVEYLIKSCGLDVKAIDKWGNTPLLRAAQEGHAEVTHFLLENGSNVHEQNSRGSSAFLLCAEAGHLAVAQYLAPKLEDHLYDTDDDGYTALHWAAQEGQLSMVKYLVRSCGFDVKAKSKNGWTAVLLAACCGHKEVVQELRDL